MRFLRALTAVVSLSVFSCGTTSGPCTPSSCNGCCDASGACQPGGSNTACGAGGSLCQLCTSVQACTLGNCITPPSGTGGGGATGGATGGGSGATGGGSATGGGGGTTTGGGSGTTGGGSGTGTCNSATCPQGCCTSSGVCITNQTVSRCGLFGNACMSCAPGQSCSDGQCEGCAGCVDPNTGTCVTGDTTASCGAAGNICVTCGATQQCLNGACAGTSCDSSNCSGCCDGLTCVPASQMSAGRCGTGTIGAACVSCPVDEICNASSQSCQVPTGNDGGTLPGFDGGFPGLDGGGFDVCALAGSPCPAGRCCDFDLTTFTPVCRGVGELCMGLTTGVCTASGSCQ